MKNNESIFDIPTIARKITASEHYLRAQNDVEANLDSDIARRRRSIKIAAHALAEKKPSGYLTLDGHVMNVTSHLTEYGSSLKELQEAEERGYSREEREPIIRKLAEFNHALKDLINSNPSVGFHELTQFLFTMNQSINGRGSGGYAFETQIRERLTGMRHEIAFEQMLGYMPGVEYEETTVEEDLHGADFKVSVKGSPFIPIDVKASYRTAQDAQEKMSRSGFNASGIIWSHIQEEDFHNSFRIPEEVAKKKAPAVYSDLILAASTRTRALQAS